MKRIFCILFLAVVTLTLHAQSRDSADGATVKNGVTYSIHGDRLEMLTNELALPFDVEVNTNGEFKVADGKERKLADGQIIRREGWLLNSDGSVEPVFNHIAVKNGKILIVRDGESEPLTQTMTFSNRLAINPDGFADYPDGSHLRLVDGQLFRLDGTIIPAKDTVTLKNERVIVQKSGTLISLAPGQIMGMDDGSRIYGKGFIKKQDGSTKQLKEGKTIFVNGPAIRH